ncbi:MAG: gluconate 2-dehydrogenase subunit 3 family protein [Pseudomonadota bacterium]|nr:gluconate 2-dehydrogenase subunit 3 family protein [Pseudomonadota bacterium]
MLFSRRNLLLSGTAAAGLTAVGVPVSVLPDAAPGFQLLSGGEIELVTAIGEAFFPEGNVFGVSAADVDLPALVDALMAEELDPIVQPVFRYLLRVVDAGTLASRGAGFAALSLADRRAVLENWSDNAIFPRRLAYDALKSVLGMAFFNAAAVTDHVGWSPTCHGAAS